jgi:hypothetical protein
LSWELGAWTSQSIIPPIVPDDFFLLRAPCSVLSASLPLAAEFFGKISLAGKVYPARLPEGRYFEVALAS